MYLSKVTLALLAIYAIINAYLVIDLNSRLEVAEGSLSVVKEQSTAATLLLLAHVDLHELTEKKKDMLRYNNYDDLLPILPKKKYD